MVDGEMNYKKEEERNMIFHSTVILNDDDFDNEMKIKKKNEKTEEDKKEEQDDEEEMSYKREQLDSRWEWWLKWEKYKWKIGEMKEILWMRREKNEN